MTDRPDKTTLHQVEVTVAFLNDAAARQRAYAERRRLWTASFHSVEPRAQAMNVSRRRGKIHDPRQGKLDI
jgi:hypothetical protein